MDVLIRFHKDRQSPVVVLYHTCAFWRRVPNNIDMPRASGSHVYGHEYSCHPKTTYNTRGLVFDRLCLCVALRETEKSDLQALTANKRPNSHLHGMSMKD